MFKIIKSLAMIAFVVAAVAGTTMAATYFSADKRVDGNTASMGTVTIGETQNLPFSLNGLVPGQVATTPILGTRYTGSSSADMYFGVKYQSGADLRAILEFAIEKYHYDGSAWVSDGFISGYQPIQDAFSNWSKYADNVNQDQWVGGKLYIRVKDNVSNANDFQGMMATNQVIIYAVQDGGSAPGTPPASY